MISRYFSLKEALYLPTWKRIATEADGLNDAVMQNLKLLFSKLDLIREHFNAPITVHCAYRPSKYNKLVGGAAKSSHVTGEAVDFHVEGIDCDTVRAEILKHGFLESLELRMEDLPHSNWVHLDIRKPISRRFFKP